MLKTALNGVNLSGAKLCHALAIEADFHPASDYLTNLSQADLSYANLSSAILSKANLRDADLTGTNLDNADLTGAIMPDGSVYKSN